MSPTLTRMFHAPHRLPAIVVAVAVVVAACGNQAIPELTDPTEIIAAAASTTAEATSVHVDLSADGQIGLDLLGAGDAAPIELADTTVSADIDLAAGDARLTFTVPGLLGLRGELIAVDGTAYLQTSITGTQYQTFAIDDLVPVDTDASPAASPETSGLLDGLTELLAQPVLEPVKGPDADCGTTTCYTVTISLDGEDLAELVADGASLLRPGDLPIPSDLPIDVPDLGEAGLTITMLVEKDTTWLAGLNATLGAGPLGSATFDLRFSKWNEDLTIQAPPADQVQGGG
jgi:hypothetical protein